MSEIQVFKGVDGKIVESKSKLREVGDEGVLIKVKACGLCHTDLHMLKGDFVLGHEPVGIVEKIGSKVTAFKVGDLVGWGYLHSSCLECEYCTSGRDVLCEKRQTYGTADQDQGGFAEYYVANSKFLSHIPEGLDAKSAAPLLCAGATVFSAIYNNDIKPTDRVAVIGMGGLGHLAIQFLAKWGCHVISLSTSESKREDALKLGAKEHVISKVKEGEKLSVGEKVNFMLSTVDGQLPWGQYLELIKPGGKLIVMGVGSGNLEVPYSPLLSKEISVGGSFVASRHVQNLMLQFAARHGIKPICEELEMNEENLNTASERLKKGDVRYRFVLTRP